MHLLLNQEHIRMGVRACNSIERGLLSGQKFLIGTKNRTLSHVLKQQWLLSTKLCTCFNLLLPVCQSEYFNWYQPASGCCVSGPAIPERRMYSTTTPHSVFKQTWVRLRCTIRCLQGLTKLHCSFTWPNGPKLPIGETLST